MDVTTEVDAGTARVRIRGEVDLGTADEVKSTALRGLHDPACRALEIDMSGVTFIDSTGIGVLVELRNAAEAEGKPCTLHRPSERVVELLRLVSLAEFFDIAE